MSLRARIFAALYDPLSAAAEAQHGVDLKRKLLGHAAGRVLEVGVGTGLSFPHYGELDELVALEPSEPMLRRARRRAAELELDVTFVRSAAEAIPFEDETFDTVVALAVLCSVEDPDRVLREIRRVLVPLGRLVFAEHVRSEDPGLAGWQDRLERPWSFIACGCHPNRRTLASIEAAGFDVRDVEHTEMPGAPRLVQPLVSGVALRR